MTSEATPIYSVVYSSTATRHMDDDDLADILATARAFNERENITGLLLYRAGRFVQFLEGDKERVRALLARIDKDSRHNELRVLIDGASTSRQFADWTMGFEPMREPTGPPPEGFRDAFDDLDNATEPHEVMHATQALSMWFRLRSGAHG
ncbi:BLUF domain-containing protein [Demequina sp. NBRC 110053]|uniref:BLUF domain-containing protein n=1 Tax=Demequina sp. NBRC 110053 TaxID=1570342 RepID=UPI000A069459|nr:BLUF domain-containing protein [Demequina sp. NBRC 110053]